jgi:two-component sensor histidine kinase
MRAFGARGPIMAPTFAHVEAASTLAVIASSNEPLLFMSDDLRLIAASASFCRAFQIDPKTIPGRYLSELGDGEWNAPQLALLLRATASGSAKIEAYEIDLVRTDQPTRNLVANASRLEDGDIDNIRLLLALTDVTDARAEAKHKDELIRQKAILLQEIQHRVANSLQIIASVLMQSARLVQSQEARGHLQDAHPRVMSIAAVQRQLATSSLDNVALRPYLVQLCESLGASMIHDAQQLTIVASVDESTVSATASISLGLIVTELVINALKHAFPGHRHGSIAVTYRSAGGKWSLSVGDDGIGMHTAGQAAKPGLGTGIVDALARQLDGDIAVTDSRPGTVVSIVHDEVARNGVSGRIPDRPGSHGPQ